MKQFDVYEQSTPKDDMTDTLQATASEQSDGSETQLDSEASEERGIHGYDICPYCGQDTLKPFPRPEAPDRRLCLYCGRTVVSEPKPIIELICKRCGSEHLAGIGEKEADGWHARWICMDCGDILERENNEETLKDRSGLRRYVRLGMHATAMGVHRTEVLEVPFEDSTYSLYEMKYPFRRFSFFKIERDTVAIDDEISLLTRHPLTTTKHFTAYGPDKFPWEETLEIVISEEWK